MFDSQTILVNAVNYESVSKLLDHNSSIAMCAVVSNLRTPEPRD